MSLHSLSLLPFQITGYGQRHSSFLAFSRCQGRRIDQRSEIILGVGFTTAGPCLFRLQYLMRGRVSTFQDMHSILRLLFYALLHMEILPPLAIAYLLACSSNDYHTVQDLDTSLGSYSILLRHLCSGLHHPSGGGENHRQPLHRRFPPQQSTFLSVFTAAPDNANLHRTTYLSSTTSRICVYSGAYKLELVHFFSCMDKCGSCRRFCLKISCLCIYIPR